MHRLGLISYNIGGARPDGPHGAYEKRKRVVEHVASLDAAIVCLQEVPPRQSRQYQLALSEYGYRLAAPAAGPPVKQMTFYHVESFARHRTFATPLSPGTCKESCRSLVPKAVLWSDLIAQDGTTVRVCNIHVTGSGFKRSAAELLTSQPDFLGSFVLGDFNLTPRAPVHQMLVHGGWVDTAEGGLQPDPGPTIHRWGRAKQRRIDWILAPEDWKVEAYRVIRKPHLLDEPSDHHLVFAACRWEGKSPLWTKLGSQLRARADLSDTT